MAEERTLIEVGYDGGQGMTARVTAAAADELEQALKSGNGGVVTLEAEDGTYTVVLARVVYVKRHARESRVGFGAG